MEILTTSLLIFMQICFTSAIYISNVATVALFEQTYENFFTI